MSKFVPENGNTWHPGSLSVTALVFFVAISTARGLLPVILLLSGLLLAWVVLGISVSKMIRRIRFLLWMLPLTFVMHAGLSPEGWAFFRGLIHGEVQLALLSDAVRFTLQISGFLMLMSGLLQLARAQEFVDFFHRLLLPLRRVGIPVDSLVQMMNLGVRFFPLLQTEIERIREIRHGFGVKESGGMRHRIQTYVTGMTSLFVGSLYRAELIGQMMSLRGYTPGGERSFYMKSDWGIRDTLLSIIVPVILIAGGILWG